MREMDVKKKKKRLKKRGRRRGGYPPIWKIIASPRGTQTLAPFRIFLAIIRVSDIGAAFSGPNRARGGEGRGEKGLTSGRNGLKKWEPRGGKWISTRRRIRERRSSSSTRAISFQRLDFRSIDFRRIIEFFFSFFPSVVHHHE